MKILVLNCGSSSIKYQLLDMEKNARLMDIGVIERVGESNAIFSHKIDGKDKFKQELNIPNHTVGIKVILDILTDKDQGVISDYSEIAAVGHRVVHGGETFSGSVLLTQEVIDKVEECIDLAPLHNPANLKGIAAIKELLPNVPQCGTFDTAFHQTMPDYSFMYAIPYSLYEKHKIRRYGFHGASHRFVSKRASELIGRDYDKLKIITCHLGNGASIAAIQNGKSIDTSMGFTPVEGLIMGTRSGDFDLGALCYIIKKEGITVDEASDMMNKKSGMLGISGISSDMRDIENAAWKEDNKKAQLGLNMYYHRIIKFIGAYAAIMNGVDAVVFTGGVGENGAQTREEICKNFGYLGLDFDAEANEGKRGVEAEISKQNSKVKAYVIPTNEELVIAQDTQKIINGEL